MTSPSYSVRAVERTIRLLEALAANEGRGKALKTLAHIADMPEPTALRYLATLKRLGFAEHEGEGEDGRYSLGLQLFVLAEAAIKPDIRALALPKMRQLRDRYQETVNLATFRQDRLIIIEVLDGLRRIRMGAGVGDQDRLRSTALGKAVLATMSDRAALDLLREEPIDKPTSATIIDDKAMKAELGKIRLQGYAIDNEESEVGVRCVGVAIKGKGSNLWGLSISGPSHLFPVNVANDAGPVLVAHAQELSRLVRAWRSGHSTVPLAQTSR